MGMSVPDDTDSDGPTKIPTKGFGARAGAGGGVFAGGELYPDTLAAAGTPSNLGKVTAESALADADPLGVNQNVTFDEVGGLDDRACCFSVFLNAFNPVAFRHQLVEGDDVATPPLPRSLPTVQPRPSSRCLVPRSTRNWKDVTSTSIGSKLSSKREGYLILHAQGRRLSLKMGW